MTVTEVWGRVQGLDSSLISQEGDVWTFTVPPWVTNPVIAEFWAKDDAGNIAYRSAVLSIENGTVKCINWMHTDGICLMQSIKRSGGIVSVRPDIVMQKHICPRMEA